MIFQGIGNNLADLTRIASVQHFFDRELDNPLQVAACNRITSHHVGAGLQAFWQFRRFWPRGVRSYRGS